ncbi:hypothetical protein [Alteromonas antoniana]|uniref:hypothetical protein n=1 Tax=Alteromonas antoniana TaxID=2803813 RepID=UPI001C43B99A|nr:hypothetical protein [Alteromonas antoniana]
MRHMSWLIVLLLILAPVKVAAADDHASVTAQSDLSLISAVLSDVADNTVTVDEESDGPDSISRRLFTDVMVYHGHQLAHNQQAIQPSRYALNGIRAPPVTH